MDINKVNISSYESWEKSVFAYTLAGHNRFQIYCATLKDIYNVFADTQKQDRASLLPKYIRIMQTITAAVNEERMLAMTKQVINSENHARIWILSKLLDTTYEIMAGED